jgi:hypothetical protein
MFLPEGSFLRSSKRKKYDLRYLRSSVVQALVPTVRGHSQKRNRKFTVLDRMPRTDSTWPKVGELTVVSIAP